MKNVLSKFWKFIVTGTRAYGPARDDSDGHSDDKGRFHVLTQMVI